MAVLLFCLLLLCMAWLSAGWQIDKDRKFTVNNLMHDGDKFCRAFAEHVRQVLNAQDRHLRLIKETYEDAGEVTVHMQLQMQEIAKDPLVIQLAVIDSNGQVMTSLLEDTAKTDRSTQTYFQAQVRDFSNRLYIGPPAEGLVSHRMSIPLSRQLNNSDGSFAGIVYLSINPEYFTKFYQDMDFNTDYTVRVIGLDGTVRASSSREEVGRDVSRATVFDKIAVAPAGFYHSPGQFTGTAGYMSYRVITDYPLMVQIRLSDTSLYPLHQRRLAYLGAAGAESIIILLFTGCIVARSRRQRAAEQLLRLSEEKYSKAFRVSPDAIVIHHVGDGRFVEVNEGFTRLTGYTREDVVGKTSLDLGLWPDQQERNMVWADVHTHGGVDNVEIRLRRKDGSVLYGLGSAKGIKVAGEDCVLSIVRDITERKQAELKLRKSNEDLAAAHRELVAVGEKMRAQYGKILKMNKELTLYREEKTALLNAIPDIMLVFNREGIVLDYAQPAEVHCSFSLNPVRRGCAVAELFPADIARAFFVRIKKTLDANLPRFYEFWTVHNDSRYWEVRFSKINDTLVLAMVRDTTAIRRSEEQVAFLSMHDPLTGAYNRGYFETTALRLAAEAGRGFGIFVFDVDGLKLINDTLGHHYGDELLKKVVDILVAEIDPPDFAARIGGDEFVVVLYQPDQQRMEELERRYHRAVDAYNAENPSLPLSLSLGWAIGEKDVSLDVVFKEADNNMYRQKMHQSHSVRSAIVQTLMKALEERDYITEGHVERLGELTEEMGQRLGLTQGHIADLRLFAKFHDIGKVGIPDSILNKTGPLTDEETVVMRRHCEIGYRIARSAPDLEPIAQWILKHHEHWDGKGYPLGLSQEEIPIECRILGIVDAYDAMTSDRPYRKAMSPQAAVAEIGRCAGTQFDPVLAEIFIAILNNK